MSVMQANKEQRVGVFIDIQNLYHSAKNLYGGRVNFDNLLKRLVNGRRLVRALGYVVKSDPATGEGAFFDALNKAGIELRIKDIQVFPDGMKKADWDVGMAVDAIRMAGLIDVVVIVSGDGDFIPLVEYLKWGLGRTVEVAAFDRTASSKLEEAADSFIDLGKTPGVVFKVFKKTKKQ